jgi:ADP-heptose:LPS heptosyltransferase
MWLSGARLRVGYTSGGGGALLSTRAEYDPTRHVSDNARRLVALAAGSGTIAPQDAHFPRIEPTPAHVSRMTDALGPVTRPLIGIHVSGGRESKQWHPSRFAEVARAMASLTEGTIVLTGGASDRPLVTVVARQLDDIDVRDLVGTLDLPETAALLGSLDLFITGDTGPMHLAGAMGTPVVALFGPSDPTRYGPRARIERILRIQLACSPCGQVRMPPERCRGHVPDCMDGIAVDTVVAAALDALAETRTTRGDPA